MTDYKPGIVAVATVRGVPNVRVIRDDRKNAWLTGQTIEGFQWHSGIDQVTDVRPLVVLDLALGDVQPENFVDILRNREHPYLDHIADQIEEQTKPPRIPEPGPWGVVRSGTGHHWVRSGITQESLREWQCDNGARADWHEIAHPVLVRDGIEDGAK